ncbi:DUF6737 family protein [Gloeobacter kilaueensis]|uniref:DUF6737 domain-containing protein n=1 Tax=Gloeobacter kilaueensis (strain ATCC BAA-2537 / CCAP 1431/1 / ULC 316 / JS1) TaxID=1183438 RepID=U5QES0_GLOK1|nr:DUF6737 family protein [Gloeobacter kilaueensis]AGY57452.1 hypothetical protein GKIL_1206 [Gloeobacter kilaueensis JS1]
MTSSPWRHKPWWCQPWSILLTGCGWIGITYWGLGLSFWWILISAPVLVWMIYFLFVWPRLMRRSYPD